MEVIASIFIIILILVIAGANIGDFLFLALCLVGVIVLMLGAFFAFCLALLFFSKLKTAVFVEFDDSGRYPAAIYDIGGMRVKNFFPRESVMRKKLYVQGKQIRILYSPLIKRTIDLNTFLTIVLGGFVFISLSVFVIKAFAGFLAA